MRARTAQLDVAAYVQSAAELRRALTAFGKSNPNMLCYVRLLLGPEPAKLDDVFLQDEELPEGCLEGACMQHLALTAASTFRNWMSAAEAIIIVLARDGPDALPEAAGALPLEHPLGGEPWRRRYGAHTAAAADRPRRVVEVGEVRRQRLFSAAALLR